MRAALLILLLANLLLYVWKSGLLGDSAHEREPERLTQQIQPQALRLVPPDEVLAAPVCRRIDGLTVEAVQALRMLLAGRDGVREIAVADQVPSEYRVLIQGLASAPAATRKQNELRARGVLDTKISEEADGGPFVVVLGSFADEERAQRHLDELSAKGVRTARVLTRKSGQAVPVVTLNLEASRADLILRDLGGWVQARAGAALNACPTS